MNGMIRRISVGWWITFVGTSLLVVLATLPPFVGPGERSLLYVAFSGVCHQIAERSPHLMDIPLAVCHRCYGAYVALPLAALSFLFVSRWDAYLNHRAAVLLTLSLIIPGVDWLGGILNFWANTALSRLLTGAIFGLVAGYFLTRALSEALQRKTPSGKEEGGTYGVVVQESRRSG